MQIVSAGSNIHPCWQEFELCLSDETARMTSCGLICANKQPGTGTTNLSGFMLLTCFSSKSSSLTQSFPIVVKGIKIIIVEKLSKKIKERLKINYKKRKNKTKWLFLKYKRKRKRNGPNYSINKVIDFIICIRK